MPTDTIAFIKAKQAGRAHSRSEIESFVKRISSGATPDYQISAWLMAAFIRGLNSDEVSALTGAMRDSGWKLAPGSLKGKIADKHSTGGVGDKTTLIIGPIVAAGGLYMPSLAGRGLGHTGGTVDKLDSIPGFKTRLSGKDFETYLRKIGFVIAGQSEEICPADRKLYELRDVTGTVDSIPLICASILSKKLAEGLDALVLDVKCGSGALMKSIDMAEELGRALKAAGEGNGVKTTVFVTNMDQPLGRFVGNSLEVKECEEILAGQSQDFYSETRQLSLVLAGAMFESSKIVSSEQEGVELADSLLRSGKALEKWEELKKTQGATGVKSSTARHQQAILCPADQSIESIDTEMIGHLAIDLGAGRRKASDSIDPSAGIEFFAKVGAKVRKDDPVAIVYANDPAKVNDVSSRFLEALTFCESDWGVHQDPLVLRRF